MPKITLPALPTIGDPLLSEPDRSRVDEPYTQSVYAALGTTDPNSGIMSTLNGRLNKSNLSSDFVLLAEHIQPEQATLVRSGSMLNTSTIYGNGVVDPISGDQAGQTFFTLPGCSVRWYQPYATSVSLMQWSFFVSYNVWRGAYRNLKQELKPNVNTPIRLRCFLDGSAVSGSDRYLAQNMFHPISPGAKAGEKTVGPGMYTKERVMQQALDDGRVNLGDVCDVAIEDTSGMPYGDGESGVYGGNPQYAQHEAHSALHFDLHHMTNLSKGWHEISLGCSIGTDDDAGVLVMNKGNKKRGPLRGRGYFNLVGKLSLGIRNARVLNLL